MQKAASINLLKGRVNLLDEIVKWALTFGRLLIIVIEFVAFGTFIYRFSLDRTIIDLHDKINQEQAIVASLKDREAQYRNTQERLSIVSIASVKGSKNVKIFDDITDFVPPEIKLENINVGSGQVTMQADVNSASALTAFLNSLKSYDAASSVTITSLGTNTNSGTLQATISIILKNNL
jgi:Tfp pilus assembly protein PilN